MELDYLDGKQDTDSTTEVQKARTQAENLATLKSRRDQMIETKNKFVTTTKIEFNLAADTTQFSVWQATTKILTKLQAIDNTLIIRSTTDNTEWKDIQTLPRDPTLFAKHFHVREENPPRGPRR